jgi:[ribosomal protein S5]-alanine N-acetyltransferase
MTCQETYRLLLRPPRLVDAEALFAFLGDPVAMRFTTMHADLVTCRRHIESHVFQTKLVGFGPWTVVQKASDEIVGFGGLYEDPFDAGWGPEVAYHFAPSAWGKGYAAELTCHCLRFGHDHLGLSEIRAFAHPDNLASRRVLAKSGFREDRFMRKMNRFLYVHRQETTPASFTPT